MNIENQPGEVIKLTLGQRLKQAREASGMSQGDVAEKQCLRLTIIRDIEADINSEKVPEVFWRGYIRAYARQVNLPEDELAQFFSAIQPETESKRTSMRNFSQKERTKKRDKWLMFFTILILLIMLGFSGIWWWQKYQEKQQEMAELIEQTTLQSASPEVKSTSQSEGPATVTGIGAQPTEMTEPVESQPVVSNAPADLHQESLLAPAPNAPALVINFSRDCWIKVQNATSNEVLYSGLKKKGQSLSFDNDIAYYLKIGAPIGVEVLHFNKKVDLHSFIKHGSTVAHVNLAAEN